MTKLTQEELLLQAQCQFNEMLHDDRSAFARRNSS